MPDNRYFYYDEDTRSFAELDGPGRPSLDDLAAEALHRHLLHAYRLLGPFVYLSVGKKRFVFDPTLARTFLLGLLSAPVSKSQIPNPKFQISVSQ